MGAEFQPISIRKQENQHSKRFLPFFMQVENLVVGDIKFLEDFTEFERL
jgi:hypothetical protein